MNEPVIKALIANGLTVQIAVDAIAGSSKIERPARPFVKFCVFYARCKEVLARKNTHSQSISVVQ